MRSRRIAAPVAVGLIYMRQRLLVDSQVSANRLARMIALQGRPPNCNADPAWMLAPRGAADRLLSVSPVWLHGHKVEQS